MLYLKSVYYSFPVQLILLYLKKYQLLLIFWLILFSTIHGGFMHSVGADALFLAPEYLDHVNALSGAIVGAATGAFIMSWNITTFILFSRHFRFLATTTRPFLKYCTNNFILPGILLIYYFFKAIDFDSTKELMTNSEIAWLIAGFLTGFFLVIGLSLLYFFGADRTIIRQMTPLIANPKLFKSQFKSKDVQIYSSRLIRVQWYMSGPLSVKQVGMFRIIARNSLKGFSVVIILLRSFLFSSPFFFLVLVGFFMDEPVFPVACGCQHIPLFFHPAGCIRRIFLFPGKLEYSIPGTAVFFPEYFIPV